VVPPTYQFDQYALGITDALTKKYSALGPLQRGGLKNDTASTTDDEAVLFNTDPSYAIQSEFDSLSKNFAATTAQQNAAFTQYAQDQKKIGMYQTASLSQDQMYKKILSDIESSYITINNKKEKGNVSDTYMAPQETVKTTASAAEYLATLPTTAKK
jgi:hypothetical protein